MSPIIRKGFFYVFRALGAVAVTAAMAVAGVELAPLFPSSVGHVLGFVALGILGLLLVLIAASCCAFAVFRKKRSESVQRMQEFYLAQREAACEDLPRAVKKLVRLRRMLDACALLTALVALSLPFSILLLSDMMQIAPAFASLKLFFGLLGLSVAMALAVHIIRSIFMDLFRKKRAKAKK